MAYARSGMYVADKEAEYMFCGGVMLSSGRKCSVRREVLSIF